MDNEASVLKCLNSTVQYNLLERANHVIPGPKHYPILHPQLRREVGLPAQQSQRGLQCSHRRVGTHVVSQLHRYKEEKSRGHVFTQRPAEFNPQRYTSYKVYETVQLHQPIDEQTFSRIVRR